MVFAAAGRFFEPDPPRDDLPDDLDLPPALPAPALAARPAVDVFGLERLVPALLRDLALFDFAEPPPALPDFALDFGFGLGLGLGLDLLAAVVAARTAFVAEVAVPENLRPPFDTSRRTASPATVANADPMIAPGLCIPPPCSILSSSTSSRATLRAPLFALAVATAVISPAAMTSRATGFRRILPAVLTAEPSWLLPVVPLAVRVALAFLGLLAPAFLGLLERVVGFAISILPVRRPAAQKTSSKPKGSRARQHSRGVGKTSGVQRRHGIVGAMVPVFPLSCPPRGVPAAPAYYYRCGVRTG